MPIQLSWQQILIRLVLTLVAGALIGLNREEKGRPAGFRTTVLICLAASISMIQANLLLGLEGKSASSFIVMDLMRLPLGILSGMGFIGAGAILKKGDVVRGVTTAATLWFATVMGLCFGGGQLGLGCASLALGIFTLMGLKWIELRLPHDRQASCVLVIEGETLSDGVIRERFACAGFRVASCSVSVLPRESVRELQYVVHWRGRARESEIPAVYEELSRDSRVRRSQWLA